MKKIKLIEKIKKSPINYFSDLFITAMVLMWIVDNVYQAVIATAVTVSSVILSCQTGMSCYDTTMWSSIGTNVAIPLSCGGAIWMIKNGIQHAISNSKGKLAHQDFPAIHPEGEDEEIELGEDTTDIENFSEPNREEFVEPHIEDISEKRKKWRKLDNG